VKRFYIKALFSLECLLISASTSIVIEKRHIDIKVAPFNGAPQMFGCEVDPNFPLYPLLVSI